MMEPSPKTTAAPAIAPDAAAVAPRTNARSDGFPRWRIDQDADSSRKHEENGDFGARDKCDHRDNRKDDPHASVTGNSLCRETYRRQRNNGDHRRPNSVEQRLHDRQSVVLHV